MYASTYKWRLMKQSCSLTVLQHLVIDSGKILLTDEQLTSLSPLKTNDLF